MPDDNCRHFIDYIPFIGLMTNGTKPPTPLTTRLFETAVMSAVAGGFATYIGVELLKADMNYIKASIQEVNVKVDKLENSLDRVKADVYVPRGKQ